MKHPLIIVIYDSITNPVFSGQVVQPLLNRLKQQPNQQITIISFEQQQINLELIKKLIPDTINFVQLKKYLFLGIWSLFPALQQLRIMLKRFPTYEIIARGPIAGFLSLRVLNQNNCQSLTVQARGLLAEEYRYAHQKTSNFFLQFLHKIRAWHYEQLEKKTYSKKFSQKLFPATIIEAVSTALKNYLITYFGADNSNIIIAQNDFPCTLPEKDIQTYRFSLRAQLNIDQSIPVYCYNGSLKEWQCPDLVIQYFQSLLQQNRTAHLLILSQDKVQFQQLLNKTTIPAYSYHILSVPHNEIYRYLAIANKGFLFRERHIINWVSRPTKLLEYRAVGLEVIHNNTIALLTEKNSI